MEHGKLPLRLGEMRRSWGSRGGGGIAAWGLHTPAFCFGYEKAQRRRYSGRGRGEIALAVRSRTCLCLSLWRIPIGSYGRTWAGADPCAAAATTARKHFLNYNHEKEKTHAQGARRQLRF